MTKRKVNIAAEVDGGDTLLITIPLDGDISVAAYGTDSAGNRRMIAEMYDLLAAELPGADIEPSGKFERHAPGAHHGGGRVKEHE